MPSKVALERTIKELQKHIDSINADRSLFHTELGKLALKHNYKHLLEFLNFTPEELIDLTS